MIKTRYLSVWRVPGYILSTYIINSFMKKITLQTLLSALAVISLASCARENLAPENSLDTENAELSQKLIFSSQNAIKGSLLVYFDDDAVSVLEGSSMPSGIATKSGMTDLDDVLSQVGVHSICRLFPVDKLNERSTREAGLHRWYKVNFDETADLDASAKLLASVSSVKRVQFNIKLKHFKEGEVIPLSGNETMSASKAPFNDPSLNKQWHYINKGDKSIYSGIREGADVNCEEAWKLCTGDPRVVVAVVDAAIQWNHPDLAANMWVNERELNGSEGVDDDKNGYVDDIYGYNFVSNGSLKLASDADAHGTHVAGTVAAVNNNSVGVCGIAGGSGNNDGVKLMSCQIFEGDDGGAADATALAFKYAADNGASILQCSFGYDPRHNKIESDDQYRNSASVEVEALEYFMKKSNCAALEGGLVVFAAGNEAYGHASYPGAYRDCIAVTSISCDYTPSYFTNYGPGCNIAAPGGDLMQSGNENGTYSSGVLSTIPMGKYGYFQGTSMACPHVSGVAALGLSYALQTNKKFTLDEFKSLLMTSVNNIDQYCKGTKYNDEGKVLQLKNYKGLMGGGYLDAYQFLLNINGTTCVPIPVGKQVTLDLLKYIGGGDTTFKILKVSISNEDMKKLGMSSAPTVFGNKIVTKCNNIGSALVKVELLSGTNSGSGINGMPVVKEFALIVRNSFPENGGWL